MIFRIIICVLLATVNVAVACEETGHAMRSEAPDAPVAVIAMQTPPLSQPFSFVIQVCSDKPMTDATVDATMPAHQHGMNYEPRVTVNADNVLQVDDMVFHMPGVWEIELIVIIGENTLIYTHTLKL